MTLSGQYLLIGAVIWAFAACAPTMPRKIEETRNYNATLLCDGSRVVKASFTPFAAMLESDGVSANLTQQPAAGGLLYTGGGQSLRAHGKEATWTDNHGAGHQCQERPAEDRKSGTPSR